MLVVAYDLGLQNTLLAPLHKLETLHFTIYAAYNSIGSWIIVAHLLSTIQCKLTLHTVILRVVVLHATKGVTKRHRDQTAASITSLEDILLALFYLH